MAQRSLSRKTKQIWHYILIIPIELGLEKKKTSTHPMLSGRQPISTSPFFFELFWTKFSLKIFIRCIWEKGGEWEVSRSHFTLKRALEISIFYQMSPLWSLHVQLFHKNFICPRGKTFNKCPRVLVFLPRCFVVWSLNHFEQNSYFKILIGCIWRNKGGGANCSQITLTFKKGNGTFNLRLKEPPLRFIWPPLP